MQQKGYFGTNYHKESLACLNESCTNIVHYVHDIIIDKVMTKGWQFQHYHNKQLKPPEDLKL